MGEARSTRDRERERERERESGDPTHVRAEKVKEILASKHSFLTTLLFLNRGLSANIATGRMQLSITTANPKQLLR
jgi:hypothetical protein